MGKKKKGMEVKERWWMNNKRMKETPPLPSPPGFACSPAPSSWKCSQCSWMPEAARGKENQGWKGQGSTGSRKVNKSIFGSIAAIKYRAKRNTKNIHPLDPGPKSFSSFQPCDRAKVRPWASALSFTNHKTHDRPRCPLLMPWSRSSWAGLWTKMEMILSAGTQKKGVCLLARACALGAGAGEGGLLNVLET